MRPRPQSTHVLAHFKLAQALRMDALLHVREEGSVELCNCAYPARAGCVVVGHCEEGQDRTEAPTAAALQ